MVIFYKFYEYFEIGNDFLFHFLSLLFKFFIKFSLFDFSYHNLTELLKWSPRDNLSFTCTRVKYLTNFKAQGVII